MLDEKIARKDMERELLNREKASQTHADRKEDEMPETSGGEEASALSVPEWEDLPEREKDFYPTFLLLLNLLLFLGGVLGAACEYWRRACREKYCCRPWEFCCWFFSG